MDPAAVIVSTEENNQPLGHGRNVAQLESISRIQDDIEAQQMLQEKISKLKLTQHASTTLFFIVFNKNFCDVIWEILDILDWNVLKVKLSENLE